MWLVRAICGLLVIECILGCYLEAELSSYVGVLRARIRSGRSGSVLGVYTVRLVSGSLGMLMSCLPNMSPTVRAICGWLERERWAEEKVRS